MDQDLVDFAGYSAPKQSKALPIFKNSDLAASIVSKGQLALLDGNVQEGIKHFDEALKLEPNNAEIYYLQGLSLFEYAESNKRIKTLSLASKKFKKATTLDPHYFSAWQAWASTLYTLGKQFNELHYFQNAREKILHALACRENIPAETIAEVYWELACIYMSLAEHSEEAIDKHQAITAFQQTLFFQKQQPSEFWIDYAKACYAFALQINEMRFYIKAIACVKNALSLSPNSYENWHLLAEIFRSLYFHSHDEEHFSQAYECYNRATQIQAKSATLWLDWATFLCASARKTYEVKRLQDCIEKCIQAFAFAPENPHILAIWAEAIAQLGCQTERVDLLSEAQNKMALAFDITDELATLWFSYGMVLHALGRYFNDLDYYYQAIEKFQEGISIDRTCHAHWHAIAQLYARLGELENNADNLERSFKFYRKALDLHHSTLYISDYAIALFKFGEITHEQAALEMSIAQFERAFALQKNAPYTHPDWLFYYACALDALGDFHEETTYYLRAIEVFSHVLIIDPEFYAVHHRLALAFSHLGELTEDVEMFYRAIHHFRIGAKQDEENDSIIVDWATTLINIASRQIDTTEAEHYFHQAEQKLYSAIQLGNPQAYYHLACLYSLEQQCEKAVQCLYRAAHFGILPSIDDILQDEWLDNLRSTSHFILFLTHIEQKQHNTE